MNNLIDITAAYNREFASASLLSIEIMGESVGDQTNTQPPVQVEIIGHPEEVNVSNQETDMREFESVPQPNQGLIVSKKKYIN